MNLKLTISSIIIGLMLAFSFVASAQEDQEQAGEPEQEQSTESEQEEPAEPEGQPSAEPEQEEPAEPEQELLELYASVAFASSYIWRGMPLNDESVIQPDLGISKGGFSLDIWGNIDTTDFGKEAGYGDQSGNLIEIDYTASYEHSFDKILVFGGFVTYTYPNTHFQSSTEAFLGLNVDVPSQPTLTYNMDVDGDYTSPAAYIALDLSHSFSVYEQGDITITIDPSAHLGYSTLEFCRTYYAHRNEMDDSWHDWSLSLAVPIGLPYGFAITPSYSFSSLIDHELRDIVNDHWDLDPDNSVFMLNIEWSTEL